MSDPKAGTTPERCPVCGQKCVGVIPYVGGGKLIVHKKAEATPGNPIPYPKGCFVPEPDPENKV